jgi:hypothetical protein
MTSLISFTLVEAAHLTDVCSFAVLAEVVAAGISRLL